MLAMRAVLIRLFRAVFRPDVPEPISVDQWRRVTRVTLYISTFLAALQVWGRFLVQWGKLPIRGGVEQYDRFLSANLPAHAVALIAALLGLALARQRTWVWRSVMMVALGFEMITAATGLWLHGAMANVNSLWFVILIVAARIALDASMGIFTMLVSVFSIYGVNAVLARTDPQLDLARLRGEGGWLQMVYILTWVIASYVALRIRTTEAALRELNATLEQRVSEQVNALERAGRLRRYLAPQVADRLLDAAVDPVSVRERRPITVMFADLKGFTQMVERLEPEVLSEVLARYFDEVAEIAFSHGGTIDKFIGDAVMVFFGAPESTGAEDQALRCVKMALEIQTRVADLADDFKKAGAGGPLAVRIGIGSGIATVGEFGARHRREFTCVGVPVNRAARLEPLCAPGRILVDEETARLVGDRATVTPAGEHNLKGFSQPQRAFEVGGHGDVLKLPNDRTSGAA
jgi:class 3 adenylate cyclase